MPYANPVIAGTHPDPSVGRVGRGFPGMYFGLYATGNGQPCRAPVDFDWFEVANSSTPA